MKGSWVLQRAESNRGLSASSFLGNERTRSEEVVEREEKSMNQSIQNYVMELACLQAMAWPIPGDHGDAV